MSTAKPPENHDEQKLLNALDEALQQPDQPHQEGAISRLVQAMRTMRPQASEATQKRVFAHATEGVNERAESKAAIWKSRLRWRTAVPVGAVLSALVITVGVVISSDGEENNQQLATRKQSTQRFSKVASKPAARDNLARSGAASSPESAAPSGSSGGTAPPKSLVAVPTTSDTDTDLQDRPRKTERHAQITLQTSDNKVEPTAQEVLAVVDRYQGIVERSTLNLDKQAESEATFQLRIPSRRFAATLAALSKLATVQERSEQMDDITTAYVSLEDRLRDMQAERQGVLRALAQANSRKEIERLKSKLRSLQIYISDLKAQFAQIKRRTDFTKLELTIVGGGKATPAHNKGGWTLHEAWRGLKNTATTISTAVIVVAAIAVPLLVLFISSSWLIRLRRRRLRRKILDEQA